MLLGSRATRHQALLIFCHHQGRQIALGQVQLKIENQAIYLQSLLRILCSQSQLRRNRLPFHFKCFPLTLVSSLRLGCGWGRASCSRLLGQRRLASSTSSWRASRVKCVSHLPSSWPGCPPALFLPCACGGRDLVLLSGVAGRRYPNSSAAPATPPGRALHIPPHIRLQRADILKPAS